MRSRSSLRAVSMRIGTSERARSSDATSSPGTSGRPRSRITRSGVPLAAWLSASAPEPVEKTSKALSFEIGTNQLPQLVLVLDDHHRLGQRIHLQVPVSATWPSACSRTAGSPQHLHVASTRISLLSGCSEAETAHLEDPCPSFTVPSALSFSRIPPRWNGTSARSTGRARAPRRTCGWSWPPTPPISTGAGWKP